MSDHGANIIVGGGQAAARAAQAMRQAGHAGPIIMYGGEAHIPYERPPLSKEFFLLGANAGFKPVLPQSYFDEQRIELRSSTRVEAIDRKERRVFASDGSNTAYDRILIATGGRLRRLDMNNAMAPNIFYVRTIDDCRALLPFLVRGRRLLVVGGGFIGLEIAAAARQRACEVVVVETGPQILGRVAPVEVAECVARLHAHRGVDIRTSLHPVALIGDGAVTAVTLSDGTTVPVDAIVVGIGVIPETRLAEEAGIETDNGILVDSYCATSDPAIFAAGDVANQYNPVVRCRLRQESWQNAQDQGVAAGLAMAGRPQPCEEVPWAWSDQYDLNIQVAGSRLPDDGIVIRGDPQSDRFTAFLLDGDKLRGAVTVNRGKDMTLIRRLLRQGGRLELAALADEAISLRDLLSAGSAKEG